MKYLKGTKNLRLILSAGNLRYIKWWYVNTALISMLATKVIQVLPSCHLKMAKVRYYNPSQWNKYSIPRAAHNLNLFESMTYQSSSHGPKCSWWKKKVMRLRGTYCTKTTRVLFFLKRMATRASGKRTQALNIHYFFLIDRIEKGNEIIKYCLADNLIRHFHAKQGEKGAVEREQEGTQPTNIEAIMETIQAINAVKCIGPPEYYLQNDYKKDQQCIECKKYLLWAIKQE